MDSTTNTEHVIIETKRIQENLLLEMIKEICNETNSKLSSDLKGKLNRIIADCDLTHHCSLHKLNTADPSTSTLLGLLHQTANELTFEEQAELNKAIISKIQIQIPTFTTELENIIQSTIYGKESRKEQMSQLQESLDEKLNTLEEQESEKTELMMEWLNHRLHNAVKFTDDSSELLLLKSKALDLKSKILYLQILHQIFTETDDSIKAYTEIHKDLKDSIKETEDRIKNLKQIIESEYE